MLTKSKSRDLGYYFGIFERCYVVPHSYKNYLAWLNWLRIIELEYA